MIELEKKLLLTKNQYDYLMEHLGFESPLNQRTLVTQINYYFDTDDFSMNRQNTTCRIRLKDEKYTATMKQHSSDADKSIETEMKIHTGLDNNAFTDMGLKLQGELITRRCVVMKDSYCEVLLDKNEYLDHTDYELEIEYSPEHEKDAQAILQILRDMLARHKCFLAYKESVAELPNIPSKSNRFFERMSATRKISHTSASEASNNNETTFDHSDPDDYIRHYFGTCQYEHR